MTTTPTLKALLARVEAAEGASSEIDRDVYRALGCEVFDRGWWDKSMVGDDIWTSCWQVADPQRRFGWLVDPVTRSVDAALAIVERVLPGWGGDVDFGEAAKDMDGRYEASVHGLIARDFYRGWGRTPALAILSALLRALISQETEVAHEGA